MSVEQELARFGAGLQAVQEPITLADLPAVHRSAGLRAGVVPVEVDLVDPTDVVRAGGGVGVPTGAQRWWLIAAAAAVVAFGGLTAVMWSRGGHEPVPAATTATTLVSQPAIDLDNYASEPVIPPGPFTVFDLDTLPAGWSVQTAGGGHRILDPAPGNYSWTAEVTTPDGDDVWLRTGRGEDLFLDTEGGQPINVDGRPARFREGGIVWTEPDGVEAMIRLGRADAPESELLALQQALRLTTIPSLTWAEPSPDSPSPLRGEPVLSGIISGRPWTLYSEPSAYDWLEMRVGDEPAANNSGEFYSSRRTPTSPTWSVDFMGLGSTGTMMWGTAPASVDHLSVDIGDDSVVLDVTHDDTGLTLFAVPVPAGLHITAIRFVDQDGNDLHRAIPPALLPPALDAVGLADLPFGDTTGQQLPTS